ncbi:uncharacterized protein I206_100302 [Kwoniella pini CBS 10737]|uniref:Uncharacterized protein n=1 Tax=Kwoniella pini CBS 10737 TaxID=1296096 RepID=A0AAJ8KZH7_9TREE
MNRTALFTALLPNLLHLHPDLLPSFLNAGNASLRQCAIQSVFAVVDVELPLELDSSPLTVRPKVNALLSLQQLGQSTRIVRFFHPKSFDDLHRVSTQYTPDIENEPRSSVWDLAAILIRSCPNIEELEWNTSFGIGGPFWEAIASLNHLTRLHIDHPPLHPAHDIATLPSVLFPRITPRLQLLRPLLPSAESAQDTDKIDLSLLGSVIGNGGWGLGIGWENLKSLTLGPLSETGAKTFANHLTLLSMRPCVLSAVTIETQFLDILLCTSISKVGSLGSLTYVELSSTGTRLTAECLDIIISGCTMLEGLKLNVVDDIVIAESTKRFSWVLDHLESLHQVPLAQLRRFAVRRLVHPINLVPFLPANTTSLPPVRSDMSLQPIPEGLLKAIIDNGHQLRNLCLDWWEMSQGNLMAILKSCHELRTLEVALCAPVASALNVPNSLNQSPLERMIITSDPARFPTTLNAKAKIDYVFIPDHLPQPLKDKVTELDHHLLDPKDLKKLARRLPNLRFLNWTGKGGKGLWEFRRNTNSSLVRIDFAHAAISTLETWKQCQSSAPTIYGEIVETSQVSAPLEIPHTPSRAPSVPVSPSSRLVRTASVKTDESLRTPRTTSSKLTIDDEDAIYFDTSSRQSLSPTAPSWSSPNAVSPTRSPNVKLPDNTFSLSMRGRATSSPRRVISTRSSTPYSIPSDASRGNEPFPLPDAIPSSPSLLQASPKTIPGSGGRTSLPVEKMEVSRKDKEALESKGIRFIEAEQMNNDEIQNPSESSCSVVSTSGGNSAKFRKTKTKVRGHISI